MLEIILSVYLGIGVVFGAWLAFGGPVRPSEPAQWLALLAVIVLWPVVALRPRPAPKRHSRSERLAAQRTWQFAGD